MQVSQIQNSPLTDKSTEAEKECEYAAFWRAGTSVTEEKHGGAQTPIQKQTIIFNIYAMLVTSLSFLVPVYDGVQANTGQGSKIHAHSLPITPLTLYHENLRVCQTVSGMLAFLHSHLSTQLGTKISDDCFSSQ